MELQRRPRLQTLRILPPGERAQNDFIDTWNFPIDRGSADDAHRGRVVDTVSEATVVETTVMPLDELLEIRRELQRSANAVAAALDKLDALLHIRQSA